MAFSGRNAKFREAYNLSYTDIYDFASKKQSLKRWQIELGLNHKELGLPWDQDVPEDLWDEVAKYCANDVITTKQTFHARIADFKARQILAEWAGMGVNESTNNLTARIIFGKERKPKLEYTDLSELFPGYYYEFTENKKGVRQIHNYYRGEEVGSGGYVYTNTGMYGNVALLDVASMHPTSIILMNMFGERTKIFADMVYLRIYIKHGELDKARAMFDGRFARYLDDPNDAKDLAQALKIAINSVYGLTAAKFDNPFRDNRNVNNICALRGALFMVELKYQLNQMLSERSLKELVPQLVHIKTDSVKIADANQEIIDFVVDFGKKYGYDFEHEATYDRFCLLNKAVYVARKGASNSPIYGKNGEYVGPWSSIGDQLIQPYVFKSLFSKEDIVFEDMCEDRSVTSPAAMYLDINENLPEGEHAYQFVGKAGLFTPIKSGCGGGVLLRKKEEKYDAVNSTKGWRWLEAAVVRELGKENDIDREYFDQLVADAHRDIEYYGDFDWFVDETPYDPYNNAILPF